ARRAPVFRVWLLLVSYLHCTPSPGASPSDAGSSAARAERAPVAVPSSVAPIPDASLHSAGRWEPPPPVDMNGEPRVTTFWPDGEPRYLMVFPTSISERGERIAALVSVMDNSEAWYLQWLFIKNVKTDKLDQDIELIDMDLSSKLATNC